MSVHHLQAVPLEAKRGRLLYREKADTCAFYVDDSGSLSHELKIQPLFKNMDFFLKKI